MLTRIKFFLKIDTSCDNCYGAGCGWCGSATDWEL